MVEKRQTCRRVLRQRDILRVAASVVGQRAADFQRDVLLSPPEKRTLNGKQRICI